MKASVVLSVLTVILVVVSTAFSFLWPIFCARRETKGARPDARHAETKRHLAVVEGLIGGLIGLAFANLISIESAKQAVAAKLEAVLPRPISNGILAEIAQNAAEYDSIATLDTRKIAFENVLINSLGETVLGSLNAARKEGITVTSNAAAAALVGQLFLVARDSVFVTSYVAPDTWWQVPLGKNYDETVANTVAKVRRFRRVFIVDSDTERRSLLPIMRAQRNQGVEVRVALRANLDPSVVNDFVVIDSAATGEMTLDSRRRMISAQFKTSDESVRVLLKRFRSIWAAAGRID